MRHLLGKGYAFFFASALLVGAAAHARTAPQVAAASPSFAGTYRYKTYRPGAGGYDNTLEVEDRGGGRLHVNLSGTYVYKAGGAETMHEGGGEGDATLRGNVATASVRPDGGSDPCRVLITFEGGGADVKADTSCDFNLEVNFTYRSEKTGAARGALSEGNALRQVRYDALSDFVGEQSNKTGSRYVITSVPVEKVRRVTPVDRGANRRGLFYLSVDENDGDVATSFVTSSQLVKALRANAGAGVAGLRVTATLAEFVGEFDIYRTSFVTKVEGLGEDGSVVWVAVGPEPVKVRMRQ